MFKSCDYCRHRKKKCVVPPMRSRCTDCDRFDLQCDFSQREPSLKRRQASKQIATRIRSTNKGRAEARAASPRVSDGGNHSEGGTCGEAENKDGDCQISVVGQRNRTNKQLFVAGDFANGRDTSVSLSDQYWRDVHPFWPFATSGMLEVDMLDKEPAFKSCVELACRLSLNYLQEPENAPLQAEKLVSALPHDDLTTATIAGALLLSFACWEYELAQKIFDKVEHDFAGNKVPIPLPILAGTLSINVWRRLAGYSHRALHLQTKVLEDYTQTLDPATFGHHYMRLSQLAVELDHKRIEMEQKGIQPDSPSVWSKLEYECFLWQVCLPSSLLDTRDDLPATPESVVIHCFSSLLLLSFYSHVLKHADSLGALMALRPVPGVLLFLCALARSMFICPRQLLDRMSLLVSIQAQTARIMLHLWRQTAYENCRAILNMWENPGGKFPELAQEVREEIGLGPWVIEEIDGYSVFWTFRDLRTLNAKLIFANRA